MPRYYASGIVATDGSTLDAPSSDGTNGQVIQTDGSGQLSFVDATSPGGVSGDIQYNNSGAFGGFGDWNGSTFTVNGQIQAVVSGHSVLLEPNNAGHSYMQVASATNARQAAFGFFDGVATRFYRCGLTTNVDRWYVEQGAPGSGTFSGTGIAVDKSTTAGDTRLLLYDVDNATLERVTVGAADSGGVGFKLLRIPN